MLAAPRMCEVEAKALRGKGWRCVVVVVVEGGGGPGQAAGEAPRAGDGALGLSGGDDGLSLVCGL